MTKLLGRLRRTFGEGSEARTEARPDAPSDDALPGGSEDPRPADRDEVLRRLRRQIAALDRRWKRTEAPAAAVPAPGAAEALPGRLVETPAGVVRVIEETHARASRHGRCPIGEFASADLDVLRRLYRLAHAPDPARMIFLDTETTGLAGGAGTLPFLVGLGWIDGGDLHVEQIFLDHPRQESAMVWRLRERFERFDHLVTYNGRAFDVPLVQNRFVLHRAPFPPLDLALDLLPGARRLHRRHLDDRSLGSIERHVLGFERDGDVPGSEIPAIYQRYLMTGRAERLDEVIRHNVWDVVALAALIGWQARLLAGGPGATTEPAIDLALGEIALEAHDFDRAAAHLECAARSCAERPVGHRRDVLLRAYRILAFVHRRAGRHAQAAACWRALLEIDPGDGAAHLGLAKYHEHRTHDLTEAARHARLAADLGAEGGQEAVRRIERIRRKAETGRPDG